MNRALLGTAIFFTSWGTALAEPTDGYSLGHIGAVRLRVPDTALFSGISSDVNAWLKPDAPDEPNTYERPIAAFDLRLWLPEVSYMGHDGEGMDDTHQMLVSVSDFDYESNPNGPAGGLHSAITARDSIDYPYSRLPNVFGLQQISQVNF
jgi:hypothetical protein